MFELTSFQNLFRDLFDEDETLLNELDKLVVQKKVLKGSFLFKEGERSDSIYFIHKGAFKLFYLSEDFKEIILSFGFENSILRNYLNQLEGKAQHMNLQAFENSVVFELPISKLNELKIKFPANEVFEKLVVNEIAECHKRILLNIGGTAEDRYDDFIENYKNQTNRIPDRYIASYIGITPEFFSKLKKKKIREYLNLQ